MEATRARRAFWTFRLLFYPAAAVAIAVLLLGRGESSQSGPLLSGQTLQGRPISMQLDGEGRPTFFDVHIVARCTQGQPWDSRWWPTDGHRIRFDFGDSRLRARETIEKDLGLGVSAQGTFTIDARVNGTSAANGTLSHAIRVTSPGGAYTCESGPVAFTAER